MNHEIHEKRNIKYEKCFVAFLDILGFQSKGLDSTNRDDTLKTLIDSLNICGSFPSGGKKVSEAEGKPRTISTQSRFFSDTIVFFMKENKEDIAQLFFMIRYLQDRLWEKRICLRGAVTIGDMFWPDSGKSITFGPALIEAYKLESEVAIYPRILVDKRLYQYIEEQTPDAYPFAEKNHELKGFLRKDSDGIYFLDLLNTRITRAKGEKLHKTDGNFSVQWNAAGSESKHSEILAQVERVISGNTNSGNEKVQQKYQWLKTYKDISNG